MIFIGALIGIAGFLIVFIWDSTSWALDFYGGTSQSIGMLFGLSGVTILLGTMMYFGSLEEPARISTSTTIAA